MFPYEAEAITRSMFEDRVREARHRRLVRDLQQSTRRTESRPAAEERAGHSLVWRLVHLPHAYS